MDNNSLMNKSYNSSYYDYFYYYNPLHDKHHWFIRNVMSCIIIGIGLPLTLMAFYGFYRQMRNDEAAPIYIINLLISDIIQFCCMIVEVVEPWNWRIREIFHNVYYFAVATSIGFMLCISMERYLVVAWPLWYRFRRTIKTSVVVCIMVWFFPLVVILPLYFCARFYIIESIFGVFLLLPLPLFIFFLVGTCKALSTSRVPSDEKRRIVAVLVLVLLIYVLLFLPAAICFLEDHFKSKTILNLAHIFAHVSPLADLFLYVFSRKGAVDKLLSSLCCCSVDNNDINTSTDQQNIIKKINIYTVERKM